MAAENQTLIVMLSLSIMFNVIIVPLGIWIGYRGVWLKIMKWKMKRGGNLDAFLYVDKGNNLAVHFESREGSRVPYKGGSYASTPTPSKLYRLWGIPLRIRRENDPEDIDIWERPGTVDMTARELDNIVNEAKGVGLAEVLKQYFPVVIIAVGIMAIIAVGGLYLSYVNWEVLKQIAPEIVKQVMSLK